MLVTTENLEYKELSVLNKGGEHSSPPTSSKTSSKKISHPKNNSEIDSSSDIVELFEHNKNGNSKKKIENTSSQLLNTDEKIKNEALSKNLEKLNEKLNSIENTELKFEQDKVTKRNLIKILDKKTKKVIRQIPPEEFYKFITELYKLNQKNDKLTNKEYMAKSDNLKGVFINENI